jgi:hypothetical protein
MLRIPVASVRGEDQISNYANMENNWENFLKNLGEWQGSFTQVSLDGELLSSTPSILSLEQLEERLVRLRLRRFGVGGYDEPPIADFAQEYSSLGRQIIFFDTGALPNLGRSTVLLPKIAVCASSNSTTVREI